MKATASVALALVTLASVVVLRAQAPAATSPGTGAFPAVMEADPGLPTHMVYRPKDLSALGATRLPIVVWGNGACVNAGNAFRHFLTEIASHGYLAIAVGPMGPERVVAPAGAAPAPPPAPQPQNAAPPARSRPPTTASQLIDGLNWAVAENARQDSPYYGQLDTTKVAAMGMSCGGLQAIDAAHDPRVTTLGVWNSGVIGGGPDPRQLAGADATKESLQTLRLPAIYISGDASDIAFVNAEDDFKRLNHVPVFRAWLEKMGHSGTYSEPNGGAFGKVAVAWLQWQLRGDANSARMFKGKDCGLCSMPGWHVQKKLID
jgi:dienelactone hydrolase